MNVIEKILENPEKILCSVLTCDHYDPQIFFTKIPKSPKIKLIRSNPLSQYREDELNWADLGIQIERILK